MTRPGRPKDPLLDPATPITRQVRALIDQAHGGNIREASRFSGIPYGTLRDLYRGTVTDPGLQTVVRLAAPYRLEPGWFLEEGETRELPRIAHVGLLPPDPDLPISNREGRRVEIPYRAATLYRVYHELLTYLQYQPPARERPILGGARDEMECRRRLTDFLFAPLLSAQQLGESVVQAVPSFPRRPRVDDDAWIRRLEALGRLWESVLPDLLRRARAALAETRDG